MDCSECGKGIQDRDTLDEHLELHSSGDGIECDQCGWLYADKRTLKCHHTKKHGKEPEWSTYECERCGVEVGHYSGAEDRVERFCRSCYQEYRSADSVTVECEQCGIIEDVAEYLDDRRFCSPDCRADWVSENHRGEDHHNWKGGRSYYRGSGWQSQRERALQRDGGRCQICDDQEQLVVHHIVSYHEFDDPDQANRLENLATLCRSCHGYLEGWISRRDLSAEGQQAAFDLIQMSSDGRV